MQKDTVETSGKTLQEACELAARELGVPLDRLAYEIVAEPRRILGVLGTGQYTLRAWAAEEPVSEEPEEAPPAEEAAAPDLAAAEGEEVAERARDTLVRLLELMAIPAEVEVLRVEEEDIYLDLHVGEAQGLIIGRHGDTLDALQFLVAVAANRGARQGWRLHLDVGDYRERQARKLRQMALRHADRVAETGKEAVIPGLRGYERRIVHLALREREDIETYSEGEGEDRQLVISPAGSRESQGSERA